MLKSETEERGPHNRGYSATLGGTYVHVREFGFHTMRGEKRDSSILEREDQYSLYSVKGKKK